MNFHVNSKNKNRKIDFLFDSTHCASFMRMGAKQRGGGVHILGQGRVIDLCVSIHIIITETIYRSATVYNYMLALSFCSDFQ